MYVSCHGHFFLVLLLYQRWSPPLRLQASHCSTFRIMCDVPSIAVFCRESIECFPGIVSKLFFKLLVTIPVAPIITGTIVHFRFHIRCISIHKLLLLLLLSSSSSSSSSSSLIFYFILSLYNAGYSVLGQIMVSKIDCDHHSFVIITFVLYLSLLSVLLRIFGEQIVLIVILFVCRLSLSDVKLWSL